MSEEEIIKHWTKYPRSNIGIITGEPSGVIILDVDGEQGQKNLKQFLTENKFLLPPTPTVRTPGKKNRGAGFHYYFRMPKEPIKSKINFLSNVDLKSTGGYVVVPPSYHPDGTGVYEWAIDLDNEIVSSPKWIYSSKNIFNTVKKEEWNKPVYEGTRNEKIARLTGSLVHNKKHPKDLVESTMLTFNQNYCKPPLGDSEVHGIVDSIYRLEDSKPEPGENLTDVGNARRLVKHIEGNFHYVPQWRKWIFWNGKYWEVDQVGKIMQAAKNTVRGIYNETKAEPDAKKRKEIAQHAMRSESENRLKAMIALAQSEPEIPASIKELDADPWKLNIENGTLCLRSGTLMPHQKEDLITKMAPVVYDFGVESPLFDHFLERVLPDPDVRKYVQKASGYSLTGDTSMEKLFFVYGPSATGKSTFLAAIGLIIGDYAATADFETFLQRNSTSGGARNDIARLAGKRMVISIEVEDGRKMAEALINQLTGGDIVAARFLYSESFEFKPQFKLWLCANNRPGLSGPDGAIWRRLVQIPFLETIPEKERNPKIKSELTDLNKHGSAILNWMLEGCLLWQKEGLDEPSAVKILTNDYREESDVLKDFLQECCILEPTAQVSNTGIYNAYQDWCRDNGLRYSLGRKRFTQALLSRGLDQYRIGGTGKRMWIGVGLISERLEV